MTEKKKLHELIERNPFANHIGMELLEVEKGFAKGCIRLEKEYTNIYGGMHGGCSYALADTLAGIAAASYGRYVTTVGGSMNYLLPVADTEYVYCEAKAVRQGKTVGVYDVVITNDAGDILCNGSFTYYRLKKEIEWEV